MRLARALQLANAPVLSAPVLGKRLLVGLLGVIQGTRMPGFAAQKPG
jgi:hypothetical protein